MSSGEIPGVGGGGHTPNGTGLPNQIPTGLAKAYGANNAPGIKKWFQTMFPSLSGKELDQAVGQFMFIQMQFMQHFMKQLQQQQKQALKQLRKSEDGD